ncbi:hypothetical protein [Flavobacterium eburneipallidum]|uniref:hypothetical protein n=1 Tax=Flavobacterium eburneipallidum TaxID=3003263 RepID=UPI002482AF15|nr:hypothetical protein [Flavobacterium eburneipallidum]
MKKLVLLLLIVIICSCKSGAQNDFDTIIHYSITDEKALQNENNNSFNKLYSGLEASKSIEKDFEKKLISYGYVKTIVPKDKTSAICQTISNDINLKYHEVACIPMYRDILLFQKDNKTKAILKVCFECGMNALSGKFESNFNYKETNIMSNYYPLYKTLYNE